MWTSAPLLKVNIPMFCFKIDTVGSSESMYSRSKGMFVWLAFASRQSCMQNCIYQLFRIPCAVIKRGGYSEQLLYGNRVMCAQETCQYSQRVFVSNMAISRVGSYSRTSPHQK